MITWEQAVKDAVAAVEAAPAATLSNRQAPACDAFNALLPDLTALAAAIEDNAIEGHDPLPYPIARNWQRHLERINRSLEAAINPPSTEENACF